MRSKKAIYNIITNLILQIVIVIYGFIVPKIIIHKFGSNANGLISSITQFLAYISLLESGFGPVVKSILYKPIANKDENTIINILKSSENFFRKIALFFLVYIILLCLMYPTLVSNEFGYWYTISLIIIIAISTFAEYFFGMTYTLFLQANQKNYIISLIQMLSYILSIISIIVLANFDIGIHLIKLISGVIFVFRPIIQNYYVKRKFKINLRKAKKNYDIKQKWDGLVQHIASVVHSNTDITLLTIFSTLNEVSVYSVYYLVIKGIRSLILSFISGIDALFGDMIAKNETRNLNYKFGMYEELYFTICTIIFTCTILLITPFVIVYTKGVNDANYIRYTLGYLIVIGEYIWAIRQPYNELIKAAGKFKETKKGAVVECITNIIISIVLIFKYGIIGVTIGTITAMFIRTIEFIYYANKNILKRNILINIKKILILIIETLIIIFLVRLLPMYQYINYMKFFANGFLIFVISSIVVIVLNYCLFKKDFFELFEILNRKKK